MLVPFKSSFREYSSQQSESARDFFGLPMLLAARQNIYLIRAYLNSGSGVFSFQILLSFTTTYSHFWSSSIVLTVTEGGM